MSPKTKKQKPHIKKINGEWMIMFNESPNIKQLAIKKLPSIIKLILIIAQILIERITGYNFEFWADGTRKEKDDEKTEKIQPKKIKRVPRHRNPPAHTR